MDRTTLAMTLCMALILGACKKMEIVTPAHGKQVTVIRIRDEVTGAPVKSMQIELSGYVNGFMNGLGTIRMTTDDSGIIKTELFRDMDIYICAVDTTSLMQGTTLGFAFANPGLSGVAAQSTDDVIRNYEVLIPSKASLELDFRLSQHYKSAYRQTRWGAGFVYMDVTVSEMDDTFTDLRGSGLRFSVILDSVNTMDFSRSVSLLANRYYKVSYVVYDVDPDYPNGGWSWNGGTAFEITKGYIYVGRLDFGKVTKVLISF